MSFPSGDAPSTSLTNAEIADRLAALAQLLSSQKANPYKVKAYRRAANTIRAIPDSLAELVRTNVDLTMFPGIGASIAGAIREIVGTGTIGTLEKLRAEASPEMMILNAHPRLDPNRVLRIIKKLEIGSSEMLLEKLESGEIEREFGARMAQHVRQGLIDPTAMLLYRADYLAEAIGRFLVDRCGVARAVVTGAVRRRVEVVEEIAFLIDTDDFPSVIAMMESYGGRTPVIEATSTEATFQLATGIRLRLHWSSTNDWGLAMIVATGSEAHLRELTARTGGVTTSPIDSWPTEDSVYQAFGLDFIEPELREGHGEIELAARKALPTLVTLTDLCGDLHAHTTASDGADSIVRMAEAARAKGYQYLGITDHSQSLKIARGVPIDRLWEQIREIDDLNGRIDGIRILKSAEVDILIDGSLDYPDEVLRELDYTICSIHSRFALDRRQQTDRLLSAMDNKYFTILGHPTGRLLLQRPGYPLDVDRVIDHAANVGCFFEINSSANRLDLSAEHARQARAAGIRIAVNTDAHSTDELDVITAGLDQARRAGLEKDWVLNCLPLERLIGLFRR